MNIWFTSDFHFSHENIRRVKKRPWNSAEEMNEGLIEEYNKLVKKGDLVYILGDFSWDDRSAPKFWKALHGNKILIRGNHDRDGFIRWLKQNNEGVYDIKNIKIEDNSITLCHYAMLTFPKSHWNAWHLYGHSHSDITDVTPGKRMNICIDLHEFKPVNFEQVKSYMKKQDNNWDYIPDRPDRDI